MKNKIDILLYTLIVVVVLILVFLVSLRADTFYTCITQDPYTNSENGYSRTLISLAQGYRVTKVKTPQSVQIIKPSARELLLISEGFVYRFLWDDSRPQKFQEDEVFEYYEDPLVAGNFVRFSGLHLVIFGQSEIIVMECEE